MGEDKLRPIVIAVGHTGSKMARLVDMIKASRPGAVGAQPNLSNWVDYSRCGPAALAWHQARGRERKFMRTHAFASTTDYFDSVWQMCGGSAQSFEKSTLKTTMRVGWFPAVDWIYDSNTAPYV